MMSVSPSLSLSLAMNHDISSHSVNFSTSFRLLPSAVLGCEDAAR